MAQVSDLGIDLGTSNVLFYQEGKGIVLRQPAVVAIERTSKKVLAVGTEAYRMIGRTPGNVLALRPLRQGVISDFELTNTMLRHFMGMVIGKRGAILKEIASRARAEMETLFGVRVNLQCWVKVKEDWRNREGLIRNFGLEANQ